MAKTNSLTEKEILHLSHLANLTLNNDEIEKYQKILTETITYAENLNELDTAHVDTTSSVVSKSNTYFEDGTENKRLLTPEEATKNSHQKKGKFFVVNRIMHD